MLIISIRNQVINLFMPLIYTHALALMSKIWKHCVRCKIHLFPTGIAWRWRVSSCIIIRILNLTLCYIWLAAWNLF